MADTVTETEKTWVSCIKARTRGNVSASTVSGLTLKVLNLTEAGEDRYSFNSRLEVCHGVWTLSMCRTRWRGRSVSSSHSQGPGLAFR